MIGEGTKFWKYQGCGNDAVMFDMRLQSDPQPVAPQQVRAICHRTLGVGADVVLQLQLPERSVEADVRMRIYNSDGDEAQMCSTGVRAIAKFMIEKHGFASDVLRVQTGRGVLEVEARKDHRARVCAAKIAMGEPIFTPRDVPVNMSGDRAIDVPVPEALRATLAGPCGEVIAERVSVLSMGNPHAIFFCRRGSIGQIPLGVVGPAIERHALFPQRVNAHFVEIVSRGHVRMRSWERGAGATLACGTGASAVVVAGVIAGVLDHAVRVDVPGGEFAITWAGESRQVLLEGPIEEVYSGELRGWAQESHEPPILPVICTARLQLRAFRTSDIPAIVTLANDRVLAEMTLTMPHPYSEASARSWMRMHSGGEAGLNSGRTYAMVRPNGDGTETLIGAVGLVIAPEHKRAEIGYWIGREHWGQGFATEAAGALLDHAFESLDIERVQAIHFAMNKASEGVIKKLGLRREGTMRARTIRFGVTHDDVIWGLTRGEWQTSPERAARAPMRRPAR